MRSCSAGVYRRAELAGRPCLLGDIGKCAAPCVGRVSVEEHDEIVDGFLNFMAGNTKDVIKDIRQKMSDAAAAQEYERAAKYRDDLQALDQALERQAVVFTDGTDADVFGFADDPLEIAVHIFTVRGGRVRGQRGWVAEKEEDLALPELIQRALMTLYADDVASAIPREILVPTLPAEVDTLTALLKQQRRGAVTIRVPKRGDKRQLMDTVQRNAGHVLQRHKISRAGDLTNRSQALEEIQEALGIDTPPLRIECFDISHTQGTFPVGSMVVFEDGLPKKSEYRRFIVQTQENNDVESMREVVRRRLLHLLKRDPDESGSHVTADEGSEKERTGFHYRPSLLVIDGGAPQVNAVQSVLDELQISDIAVCGLAKRLEEVWLPYDPDPVIFSRSSQGLYLLQRIRDEAHRFAISHHRAKRSRAAVASQLDTIAGIGPNRRKLLLKHFGSFKAIKAATVEDLSKVPGIGPNTAQAIAQALSAQTPSSTVDMSTGEIIEEVP